ncbi:aspartate/glutamate racemase family protein [Foetidibacter luteolus]|uniref:aspartate/glutamate racemase family protein n=1 Tax=Foetidibacter luteolus TaxID=2608880 RepID=UPI00129B8551|nr:aspartate/glutamate racemase family protein [Foetidibacter luteolus]
MKTIGLIGGLTWLSTLDYYRLLNQLVQDKTNGAATAKIFMYSVDFGEIKRLTEAGDWSSIAVIICTAAKKLQEAGADCLLVGANTMHKIADEIQAAIHIPLIHIADETANAITEKQLKKVALLGTKYTMQLDFYKNKLAAKGIETIIPGKDDIEYINKAIYDEMGRNIFLEETKAGFLRIIHELIEAGAEGVIFGCTEIPILIKQDEVSIPVFDTTEIHTRAAVAFALA